MSTSAPDATRSTANHVRDSAQTGRVADTPKSTRMTHLDLGGRTTACCCKIMHIANLANAMLLWEFGRRLLPNMRRRDDRPFYPSVLRGSLSLLWSPT